MHAEIKRAFGEEVTYSAIGETPVTITGVFNNRHRAVDPDTEQFVDSVVPTLGVDLSDLPREPQKGDGVTLRGQAYRVASSEEDGEGWSELFLYEVS